MSLPIILDTVLFTMFLIWISHLGPSRFEANGSSFISILVFFAFLFDAFENCQKMSTL